jgi:hypothetical protein
MKIGTGETHTDTSPGTRSTKFINGGGGLKFPAQHQGLKKCGKEYALYGLRKKVNQQTGTHKTALHHRIQPHSNLAQTLYTTQHKNPYKKNRTNPAMGQQK